MPNFGPSERVVSKIDANEFRCEAVLPATAISDPTGYYDTAVLSALHYFYVRFRCCETTDFSKNLSRSAISDEISAATVPVKTARCEDCGA